MGLRTHGRVFSGNPDKRTWFGLDPADGKTKLVFNDTAILSETAIGSGIAAFASLGAMLPAADDAHDLGSSALQWKDGYFDGVLYADAIDFNGTAISSTAAELNYLDLTTLGTGAASKAVVLDAGEDYTWPVTGIATLGEVRMAGKFAVAQGAPTAKTATAAITAAELVTGIITTTGVTGPSVHQLPTGTLLLAQLPGLAAGQAFDFFLINTGVGASDDATITVNTDVTIVGNPTVGALTDATILSGSGHFRARYTGGVTFIVYRLA